VSDELDAIKGGGIGAFITAILSILWGWFKRTAEKNADRVEADREARLIHCEKSLENHRERIGSLETKSAVLDDRVATLQGVYRLEPVTNPGLRPSPELAARIAEAKENFK
jgi:hypothetical protein